jgi:hypothetical protein
MRLQRIRLLDRLIYSYLSEPRWQQALSLDCGVNPFGSAFLTRSFTLENLAGTFESALTLQHGIPCSRGTLLPARHSFPYSH